MNFRGKTVIVTGAGKGIGRCIAQGYAYTGAKVVIADINEITGNETSEQIKRTGGDSLYIRTDISVPSEIEMMVKKSDDKYGRIDILVNNAAVNRWSSPYELPVEEWDRIINTNLRSVFLCSRAAAVVMKRNGGGAIVNISSTRAIMSEPDSEAYAASKGGVIALTHAMSVSLSKDRIRVNAISPGWIETENYAALRDVDHEQHIAGRVGKPEDIASACRFLTSAESGFITGANLIIDGGMTRKMIYRE